MRPLAGDPSWRVDAVGNRVVPVSGLPPKGQESAAALVGEAEDGPVVGDAEGVRSNPLRNSPRSHRIHPFSASQR